jgi:hypothetical protein
MLDWDWANPLEVMTGTRKPCAIDWDYRAGSSAGWGLLDSWRRKGGIADFNWKR